MLKILVMRMGRLGDICMLLPALKALHEQYPQAKLDVVTSPIGKSLLQHVAVPIDKIWVVRHRVWERWYDVFKLKRMLRENRFDKLYCCESKGKYQDWLKACQNVSCLRVSSFKHFSMHLLDLVDAQVDEHRARGWSLLLPNEQARVLANHQFAAMGVAANDWVVAIHPTFSHFNQPNHPERKHRLWPVECFVELAVRIESWASCYNKSVKIVMDVLPEERDYAQQIVHDSGGLVHMSAATPNMARYIAFLHKVDVLVSANTGPMHLAAAVGAPQVALFSGFDPKDCGPFAHAQQHRVLQGNQEQGIRAISPASAAKEVIALLQETK